jgi:hypothetical protein
MNKINSPSVAEKAQQLKEETISKGKETMGEE